MKTIWGINKYVYVLDILIYMSYLQFHDSGETIIRSYNMVLLPVCVYTAVL